MTDYRMFYPVRVPGRTTPAWAQGRVNPTTVLSPGAEPVCPKDEMRMAKPVAYASTIWFLPITRPTCPGSVGVPSEPAKKTRSPGSSWPEAIFGPQDHWACEV